ncbi:MAG: glycosyltransferase family 2 protein [Methylococcales bacterium]
MDKVPYLDAQVPEFEEKLFFPRRHAYCVCVFVINEGEKIRAQLTNMAPLSAQVDIIIADGGSSDGSLDDSFLKRNCVHCLLTKTEAGQLGTQMRMAFAHALKEGYAGIIAMDGNNKDDPASIPLFIEALDAGWDHVQGSRFVPGGRAINTPVTRLLGLTLLHAPLISLSSGFRYTDTTNGFRAYSRRLLLDPRVAPFRCVFVGYELHYYLAIRSVRLGFRVKEVPVTRSYPKGVKIPTKISPVKGNLNVLVKLFNACLGRYDPEPVVSSRDAR